MIECTDKYIWYKRKNKRSYKFWFITFFVLVFVFSLFFYYYHVVCKQIFNICSDYAYSYSADAVNLAVLNTLDDKVKYDDLVQIQKNNNDEITLISLNNYKINLLNKQITELTTKNIQLKLNQGIPVPRLAFTGVGLLSGYGKLVYVKTINIASVVCEFDSNFTSVGINQTLHSLYIEVISTINIKFPLNNMEKACKTKILISETILVGKVPEFYLNGGLKT